VRNSLPQQLRASCADSAEHEAMRLDALSFELDFEKALGSLTEVADQLALPAHRGQNHNDASGSFVADFHTDGWRESASAPMISRCA
jgi:hypothetical protein